MREWREKSAGRVSLETDWEDALGKRNKLLYFVVSKVLELFHERHLELGVNLRNTVFYHPLASDTPSL